jgi:hypothetical protein
LRELSQDADLRAGFSSALASFERPSAGPHIATAVAETAAEDRP